MEAPGVHPPGAFLLGVPMFLLDDILAAKAAGKILPMAVGAAVLFGIGFAAAEAFEHRGKTPAPISWIIGQGLAYQRDTIRDSIPTREAAAYARGRAQGVADQAAVDAAAFASWSAQLATCRTKLDTAQADARAATTRTEAFTRSQASAAYDMGRATCKGGSDANRDPSRPRGDQPGRVPVQPQAGDDFGDVYNRSTYPGS